MTKEEAVEILWRYDVNFEPHPAEAVMHAIDMAIEALRSSDVPDANVVNITNSCSEIPNSIPGDCINRQAAIDALHMHLMYRMGTDSNKKRLDEWINNLPSAQPVLTCDGCKYKGTYSTDMPCRGCLRREEDLYVPE